jgi:preprotein translocase subunit SecY
LHQPLFLAMYGALIALFALIVGKMIAAPRITADNLSADGAFVPGLRPGAQTADYLEFAHSRLAVAGAMYLAVVCIVPDLPHSQIGMSFRFFGTGLLIVVITVMEIIGQAHVHLRMGTVKDESRPPR